MEKMTEREMTEYRNFHDTRRVEMNARTATPEQLAGFLGELDARVCRAEQDVASAKRNRPSYAPAGIPTKTERDAQTMLIEAAKMTRYYHTVLA